MTTLYGRCAICGEPITTGHQCKHDHRPTPLYPGYDGSGFPMTQEQRCEAAAKRLVNVFEDMLPENHWWRGGKPEMERRIKEALMELFP